MREVAVSAGGLTGVGWTFGAGTLRRTVLVAGAGTRRVGPSGCSISLSSMTSLSAGAPPFSVRPKDFSSSAARRASFSLARPVGSVLLAAPCLDAWPGADGAVFSADCDRPRPVAGVAGAVGSSGVTISRNLRKKSPTWPSGVACEVCVADAGGTACAEVAPGASGVLAIGAEGVDAGGCAVNSAGSMASDGAPAGKLPLGNSSFGVPVFGSSPAIADGSAGGRPSGCGGPSLNGGRSPPPGAFAISRAFGIGCAGFRGGTAKRDGGLGSGGCVRPRAGRGADFCSGAGIAASAGSVSGSGLAGGVAKRRFGWMGGGTVRGASALAAGDFAVDELAAEDFAVEDFGGGVRRRGKGAAAFGVAVAGAALVARCDSRKWAMMKWPRSTARSAGVFPAAFLAPTSAPAAMAALTPGISLTSTALNKSAVAAPNGLPSVVRAAAGKASTARPPVKATICTGRDWASARQSTSATPCKRAGIYKTAGAGRRFCRIAVLKPVRLLRIKCPVIFYAVSHHQDRRAAWTIRSGGQRNG